MKERRYRGKKDKEGRFLGLVALLTIGAILALTIHANSQWTGRSAEEQVYEALFVAKDWD